MYDLGTVEKVTKLKEETKEMKAWPQRMHLSS